VSGGEVALIAGVGLVGLYVVYRAGKSASPLPLGVPGTPAPGSSGTAPGSTTGTGTSTGVSKSGFSVSWGSVETVAKTAIIDDVVGAPAAVYYGASKVLSYL
jgi:hypothetical protein